MKIYWSFKSIPEFKGISKEERKIVWNMASVKSLKQWSTYIYIIGGGLLTLVLPDSLGSLKGAIGSVVGSFLVMQQVYRNSIGCLSDLKRQQKEWTLYPKLEK